MKHVKLQDRSTLQSPKRLSYQNYIFLFLIMDREERNTQDKDTMHARFKPASPWWAPQLNMSGPCANYKARALTMKG